MKRAVAFFGRRRILDGRKTVRVTVARWDRDRMRIVHTLLKHVERHSEDGFEWGSSGGGSSDLALSLLTEMSDEFAPDVIERTYKGVCDRLLAPIAIDTFQIIGEIVRQAVADALKGAKA